MVNLMNDINQDQLNKIQRRKMNYLSFSTFTELTQNSQFITQHINKNQPNNILHPDQCTTPTSSPVKHKTQFLGNLPLSPQYQSKYQHNFDSLWNQDFKAKSNIIYHHNSSKMNSNTQKNLDNLKFRPLFRQNIGKRYVKNHVIEEIDEKQKYDQVKQFELKNSKNMNKTRSYVDFKFRKSSWNPEVPSFLKKPGRKNSDEEAFKIKEQKPKFVKKKSQGWAESQNFHFATKTNSDSHSNGSSSPVLFSPKLKNLRKQSDNVNFQRTPSFIMKNKSHRQSLDILQENKLSIDNFKIIKDLGKGTFGRVVLAYQKVSRLVCAIKIMSKRQIKENNMLEQLIRQFKIQFFLNHPNIVKVYALFDDLLYCYIVQECALDGHLSQYIKKTQNPLPEKEASHYLYHICSAVSTLHTSSIIHRDLKPQNVLLHQGVIKLCDFGWSVYRDANLRTTFCGTPAYLCPQVLVGDSYDQSVDIWTIGIILYQMFFKKNPFRIKQREDLINILNEPIDFSEIKISESAKNCISLCLQKRATERPNIKQLLLHEFILQGQQKETNNDR